MITLSHLIYDIIGIASSGSYPNEMKISNEQCKFWVEEVRAQLIGQALNKRDDIHDSWIQYIGCLELEPVEDTSCCLADSDCHILKSIKRIPSTIDTWKDNMIISVTTTEGVSIPKSNPIRQKYQKYNKYASNRRSWYLKDNYLYIINDTMLTYASLSGIFETPSELSNFVECSGESCFSETETPYPVSLAIASQITDIVVKTKAQPFFLFPSDESNNANSVTPKQAMDNNNTNE